MKSLITPAAVCTAIAGYFIFEALQLSVSEGAYARAGDRWTAQLLKGQELQPNEPGKKQQGIKDAGMHDGSEILEFEGDIFADVPEHMAPGDSDAESSRSPAGDDNKADQK
ncbi:hypothetical protein ACL7TT_11110 [Microbulbifer sp. 2304DJ12-6]|uniref:hypothetical protein n=1 Tax=Microbulbifer sp. 2304DJ12-6 TaxID=3233340 RepID=UPI0039AFD864